MDTAFWWNLLGIISLIIFAFLLFRHYFLVYTTVFFAGRAFSLALIKTGLILLVILGLFFAADRLLRWWMPPGAWQTALAFLIPSLFVSWVGQPLARLFDRLQGL